MAQCRKIGNLPCAGHHVLHSILEGIAMTKSTKLTVAKVVRAMEAYEQMADFRYNGITYDNVTLEDISITEVKARFRKALGLPEDFRLTAKRMNDISDDLDGVTSSCSARGKQISIDLLADTLYTLKWPTAYAKSLKQSLTGGK